MSADLYFRRTTNGGLNWINVIPILTATIMDITFVDELTGIAIANGGRIYRTIDGGINWTEQSISMNINLNDITMINSQTGYICGDNGLIAKTFNGGLNWSVIVAGINNNLHNIVFYNENTGYVVHNFSDLQTTYTRIRLTTNGGIVWSEAFYQQDVIINKSIAVNENRIMFAGIDGFLEYSEINGNFVSLTNYKFKNSIKGIKFINDNTGIILNDTGQCLMTTDGGNVWNQTGVRAPNNLSILKGSFINENTGFVIGQVPNEDNLLDVFRTGNRGINWTRVSEGLSDYTDISIIDEQNLLMSSFFTLYKSTNSGINWTVFNPNSVVLFNSKFLNQNTGYAFEISQNSLLKTTNGGSNWFTIFNYPNVSSNSLNSFHFINVNTGFLTKSGSSTTINPQYNILRTLDGGISWDSLIFINGGGSITDVWFKSANEGFIISDNLFKTTNGGINFININLSHKSSISKLYFLNENIGFAYTFNRGKKPYSLMKTTNGGVFVNNEIEFVNNYSLFQNYPNPFNPVTTIKYNLSTSGMVRLKVFDVLGREVRTLVNEFKSTGTHSVDLNASDLSSGIYFYRIIINSENVNSGEYSEVRKMILLK